MLCSYVAMCINTKEFKYVVNTELHVLAHKMLVNVWPCMAQINTLNGDVGDLKINFCLLLQS